ncbi:hypothetical protein D3C85_1804980 [compost metagenome]
MSIFIFERDDDLFRFRFVFQSLHHFFSQKDEVEFGIIDRNLSGFQFGNGIQVINEVA